MAGNQSRHKGLRNEYALRDAVRAEGFVANRVPSSGAAEGFKGDVTFAKDGIHGVMELKARKASFGKVYLLYDTFKTNDVFSIAVPAIPPEQGVHCISIHPTLAAALGGTDYYLAHKQYTFKDNWVGMYNRTVTKLVNMKEMKGKSDILVVKDDRRPFLFIRYR
jgi:Holliday junction resolvase